jgi:hypothetical protein
MAGLPAMSVAERQLLVRRTLELDEPTPSTDDVALLEERLADHRRDPASALSLAQMRARVRAPVAS